MVIGDVMARDERVSMARRGGEKRQTTAEATDYQRGVVSAGGWVSG